MNRRVISILAVLAMLCTMFTFAMPVIAETTALAETYPNYADHVTATENGHDGKNWSISTAADWKAMMETANTTSDVEYFKGVTFHLTGDVSFKETEWLLPMGAGKYFSGTINGNGYGFDDFKIYENTGEATTGECATGMFYRLGNCHFVDFGINSGTIIRAKDNAVSSVTTFGGVANGYAPTFTRVWSGAMLSHTSSGTVSALAAPATIVKEKDNSKEKDGVGTKADNYTEPFVVNGFVFDGQILNEGKNAFSILGTYPSMTVGSVKAGRSVCSVYSLTNVITDAQLYLTDSGSPNKPTSTAATGVYKPTGVTPAAVGPAVNYSSGRYSMLFSSNSTATIQKSTFENLYTVEYPNTTAYLGRSDTRTADPTMMAKSALEAAWTINSNPSEKADKVYFTLNEDNKIRPTAKSENMIVKVTLTGDREKVYYLNANTTYDHLDEVLEKKDQHEFEVSEGTAILQNGQLQLKDGDVTINVTINCDHPSDKVHYEYTENAHIKTCAACDFYKEIPCSAEKESDYTIDPIVGEDLAAVEKATHSGTCQFCKEDFTLECTVSYVPADVNKDAYWKFSDCVCGRKDIEHAGTEKALCGDVNGSGAVDLMDAVLILRKYVGLGELDKEHNADVDGDYDHDMDDVVLAVQRWLGNKDAKNKALQTENRINENVFNSDAVTKGILKMDGTEGNVEGYVVSDPIAVHSGEKLSFGPVRLSAPVMGYFYDAEGNPLQLINHTNVKVEYTFEEGKALVSIDVPAGAESVRFQLATEEVDQFYLRVNAEITGMDYEERFAIESSAIDNPLKDRTFLTVGDSLCAAANDAYVGNDEIGYVKGWARRIRDTFGAKVTNSARGGSTLSTSAWHSPKGGGEPVHYIFEQLNQHSGVKNFDYILLEGGVNDHRIHNTLSVKDPNNYFAAPIGTIVEDSYDPADFDAETTLAGGMERLIYKAIKDHGDTAALGYIALYEMYTSTEGFANAKGHLDMAKLICKKWGIPYVDFYNEPIEGFNPAAGAHTSDSCHALAEGYDLMQPRINELCLEMRPISQEIYNAVQATAE